ncbi:MAG: hypothetical protein LBJ64_09580 [Deltaproteobacteria bacterium]|jgi:OOP family OmpA-OmpF porin|nr:hypothetical protein [Deltaproteobacteria bacterium]
MGFFSRLFSKNRTESSSLPGLEDQALDSLETSFEESSAPSETDGAEGREIDFSEGPAVSEGEDFAALAGSEGLRDLALDVETDGKAEEIAPGPTPAAEETEELAQTERSTALSAEESHLSDDEPGSLSDDEEGSLPDDEPDSLPDDEKGSLPDGQGLAPDAESGGGAESGEEPAGEKTEELDEEQTEFLLEELSDDPEARLKVTYDLSERPDAHKSETELLEDIEEFFLPDDSFQSPQAAAPKSSFDEADFLNNLDDYLGQEPKSEDSAPENESLEKEGPLSELSFSGESSGYFGSCGPEGWPAPPEDDSEMGQLRKLLMAREMAQLSYFSDVITEPANHAQALSQVITEALLLRTRKDDKLNLVLGPTVERIVSASVRRNPETLANSIFPVIGPAIRRSISETFSSMLQNFNSTLEKSLSLQGLKWRLEALRVKKPFSEIVLLHTLLYHVEEIYLIHAASGLVLDHLVSEGGETRDSDLVAGMFTAIQDFIKDSFSTDRNESLDNLRLGERSIFIRRADPVYMACVVRGNPPASLGQDLQEALDLVVVDCADELERFKGDTEPFKKCRRYLDDFLTAKYQEQGEKPPLVLRLLPAAILLAVVFGLLFSFFNRRVEEKAAVEQALHQQTLRAAILKAEEADRSRFEKALDLLRQEPGLAVADVSQELPKGRRKVTVLRDSLSRSPAEVLIEDARIEADRFELIVKPYISLDEAIVQRRIRETIKPLADVDLNFDGDEGLLTLSGSAPLGWIMKTRELALTIPGVIDVDVSALRDPRTAALESLTEAINGVVIHFPTNSDQPIPEDQAVLVQAVDNLTALEKLAAEMQMSVSLVIYGHADAVGGDRRNYELSQERTKTLASMLYSRGSSIPITNYGLGSQHSARSEEGPPKEDLESRKIELRVRLTQGGFVH